MMTKSGFESFTKGLIDEMGFYAFHIRVKAIFNGLFFDFHHVPFWLSVTHRQIFCVIIFQ